VAKTESGLAGNEYYTLEVYTPTMPSIMDFVNTMTTEEERGTCGECERTDQKDCIVLKFGAAGNPVFVCPDCVRGKQTGESSESEEESEDEKEVPTFTEGQVRKFPNPLLNGMREKDVDGKWWIAHGDEWFLYGDEGSVSDNESETFYCDVKGHEDEVLIGNSEDGWVCPACEDSDEDSDSNE